MDWLRWGIVASDIVPDGWHSVREWSLLEVVHARMVIDAVTAAREQAEAVERAKGRQ